MFITADNHMIASFLETVSTISKDIILKKGTFTNNKIKRGTFKNN